MGSNPTTRLVLQICEGYMKVKDLLEELKRCDPEATVELRVTEGGSRKLTYIHNPFTVLFYKQPDGSYGNTPPDSSVWYTEEHNTIILTNFFMTASAMSRVG